MDLTHQQLRNRINNAFREAQMPEVALGVSTEDVLAEFLPDAERLVEKSLTEKETYYAIRDDDLKLLDESAAVAAGLWAIFNNPVTIIGKLAVLLYRYRRKRVKLTNEQGIVLLTLKQAPAQGWNAEDVAKSLPLKSPMPPAAVLTILQDLKRVRRADGVEISFVAEVKDSWLAVDV